MFNSKLGKKEKKNDTNFLPSLQLLIHRVYYLRKERRNIIKSTMSRKIASKKNNAYIHARHVSRDWELNCCQINVTACFSLQKMRRKWWPDRETKYGTGLAECLAILGSLGHPKYPSLQLLSLPVSYTIRYVKYNRI